MDGSCGCSLWMYRAGGIPVQAHADELLLSTHTNPKPCQEIASFLPDRVAFVIDSPTMDSSRVLPVEKSIDPIRHRMSWDGYNVTPSRLPGKVSGLV